MFRAGANIHFAADGPISMCRRRFPLRGSATSSTRMLPRRSESRAADDPGSLTLPRRFRICQFEVARTVITKVAGELPASALASRDDPGGVSLGICADFVRFNSRVACCSKRYKRDYE